MALILHKQAPTLIEEHGISSKLTLVSSSPHAPHHQEPFQIVVSRSLVSLATVEPLRDASNCRGTIECREHCRYRCVRPPSRGIPTY
jgi:hypothetical protein